jgi:hypothetical protein
VAFGAGLSWAAAVVKWTAVTAPTAQHAKERTPVAKRAKKQEPITVS